MSDTQPIYVLQHEWLDRPETDIKVTSSRMLLNLSVSCRSGGVITRVMYASMTHWLGVTFRAWCDLSKMWKRLPGLGALIEPLTQIFHPCTCMQSTNRSCQWNSLTQIPTASLVHVLINYFGSKQTNKQTKTQGKEQYATYCHLNLTTFNKIKEFVLLKLNDMFLVKHFYGYALEMIFKCITPKSVDNKINYTIEACKLGRFADPEKKKPRFEWFH